MNESIEIVGGTSFHSFSPGVCLGPRDFEAHRRDVVLVLRAVLAHAVDPRTQARARPRHQLLQLLPHLVQLIPEVGEAYLVKDQVALLIIILVLLLY